MAAYLKKCQLAPCTNVFQSHCIAIFQMHFFIAMSFTTTYYDKAKFDNLFKQNNEDLPSIIVMENSEKMYEDVITDPESVESTVKSLLLMDPTLANLLIDYFEVHTWSKTCLTAIDCFELDIAVHL